jgi:hypothetical protein
MEQLAIAGFICFVVGGVFGWVLKANWKKISGRVGEDLGEALDRIRKERDELLEELKKYKNK